MSDTKDSIMNLVEFTGLILDMVDDEEVVVVVEGEGDAKLAARETPPNRIANRIQAKQRFTSEVIVC